LINCAILTAFNVMWCFNAGTDLMQFVNVVILPTYWKGEMFGLAVVNFVVLLLLELLLVPLLTWVFNWIGTLRMNCIAKHFKRKVDFNDLKDQMYPD
jgi:hypothetical protein